MSIDLEYPYLDTEVDDDFLECYETKGVRRITELSRQVRTMLNYKTNIIRCRFRSNSINQCKLQDIKFHETKNKFETVALQFIKLLNKIKRDNGRDLDKEIQVLLYRASTEQESTSLSLLKQLKDLVFQLFMKIHYFSEQNLYDHPYFLNLLIKVARETCNSYKNMDHAFSEFYAELGQNYNNLEKDIESLVAEKDVIKVKKRKKQLNIGLIS